MTERFIIPNQLRVIRDTVTGKEATFFDSEDGLQFKEWLNDLNEENKQLKLENKKYYKEFLKKDESIMIHEGRIRRYQTRLYDLEKENEQLKEGLIQVIDKKIKEREYDIKKSIKAGMPTSLMYSEIELLEELKEEIKGDI